MTESLHATDPLRVFETLNRHDVDYAVIGGVAVIAWGHTRNTRDVDIVARLDAANLERLAVALAELGARLSGVDAHLLDVKLDAQTLGNGANFTMETDAGGLDFCSNVPGGAPYQELRERTVTVDVAGVAIRIVGLDDLIRMKLAAGRPQDLEDVAVLRSP